MYAIIDLCLLCLTNNKNLKSIFSRDSDGVLVEEKLRFFLFELGKINPEILKQICLPCLDKLNYIYNYKQQCLRNIDKLNSYKYTLNTAKERCTNIQVQFDTSDLKASQVTRENKDNSEPVRSENFNLENIIVTIEPSGDDTKVKYVLQGEHGQKPEIEELLKAQEERSESINLENVIVKKEPNVDDTETKFVLQGEHGQKPEIEQLLKEDIVMIQKPGHNSDNSKAQEDNAFTGIEETKTTEDEVKFEFDDVIVKEEPEDLYNETDTWSKLCDLKEELQNETANNTGTFPVNENITKKGRGRGNKNIMECIKKLYICKDCNKSFPRKSQLTVHERVHRNARPFKCVVCNKTFTYKHHLMKHEFVHSKIRHKCSVCGKAFTQSKNLARHKHIHTGEKSYKCAVCNKEFTRNASLTKHRQIHTFEKTYKCNICNKTFTRKNYLTTHERIHTGEKPYKCDVCNRAFGDRSHLTVHERIHNNVRPYKCSVCNQAFREIGNLIKHKRIHTGEKPYKCNVCNRTFTQKSSLTAHERIHDNVRPYKCSVCNKTYTGSSGLTNHMRIHNIKSQV